MTERKLVKDRLDDLDFEHKSIDEAIEYLKKLKEQRADDTRYQRLEILTYPSEDSYSDKEYLCLAGVREETDAEQEKRLNIEQEQRARTEEYEKQQLARLLLKYVK